MDEDMIKRVAKEVVPPAVRETLVAMGIDAKDPMEAQKDFHFLRDLRTGAEGIKGKARVAAVGVLVAAGLGLLWMGFKAILLGG